MAPAIPQRIPDAMAASVSAGQSPVVMPSGTLACGNWEVPSASARNCRAAPAIKRPPTNRPTASTRVRLKAVPASTTNTAEPESCQALQPTRARSTPSHGGMASRGMSAKPMRALPSRPTWSGMGPTAAQPASRTPSFRKPAMGAPSKLNPGGASQVRQPSRPWEAQCQRLLPINSQ